MSLIWKLLVEVYPKHDLRRGVLLDEDSIAAKNRARSCVTLRVTRYYSRFIVDVAEETAMSV